MKLVTTLGFLVAMATLAGCELYYGDHGGTPSAGGGGGTGYQCSTSSNCAAGCYCSSAGVCEEGGFCTTDADCGTGYHCDTSRNSCEPNPSGCTADSDCSPGAVCNNGTCGETCTCATDADAVKQGFGYCDEARMTCMKGSDPNGSCAGTVTCTTAAPKCPSGQVPLISMGCYTGACEAIAACDAAPACTAINDETDCLARADCGATYTGVNCHKPDGSACHAGDTNCTCSNFVFNSCTTKAGARIINEWGETLTDPAAR